MDEIAVAEEHPLKQGLKHITDDKDDFFEDGCRGTSIKTRIETIIKKIRDIPVSYCCRGTSIKTRIETITYFKETARMLSCRGTSIKTRIETAKKHQK